MIETWKIEAFESYCDCCKTSEVIPSVGEIFDAYQSEIERLEAENARLMESRKGALELQRHQFESHKKERIDTMLRHKQELCDMAARAGFAAKVYDRTIRAEHSGRKTVKIADLLDGRPEVAA